MMYAQRWSLSGGNGPPSTQLLGVQAKRSSMPLLIDVLFPCSSWTQSHGSADDSGAGEHESDRVLSASFLAQPSRIAFARAAAPWPGELPQ